MKAIIFDLDNTLIDFIDRKKLVIQESVKAMIDAGINETFEKLHKEFSDFYWKKGIEDQKIFQLFLKKKYGKIDYKVLAHAIIVYRQVNSGLLRPYPGTKRLLISLKKRYKLAVLSDAPKLSAYLRLFSVGLDDFFDLIISKDDVKVTKPNKKGFLEVAKRLKISPSDCIMVGDMPDKDMIGAKQIGMKTIFAEYGNLKNKNTKHSDYIAKNIMDIEKITLDIDARNV